MLQDPSKYEPRKKEKLGRPSICIFLYSAGQHSNKKLKKVSKPTKKKTVLFISKGALTYGGILSLYTIYSHSIKV